MSKLVRRETRVTCSRSFGQINRKRIEIRQIVDRSLHRLTVYSEEQLKTSSDRQLIAVSEEIGSLNLMAMVGLFCRTLEVAVSAHARYEFGQNT